eukprot:superscaffoldBa00002263_g13708
MSVKAFELVPAVERDLLMGDKARINIECIECCGKHLYVGTNDCFIHHFLLDEVTSSKGKLSYSSQKLLHKYLGLKKPVAELRAASALERLIVLCDGIVFLVDMVTLETVPSAAGGGAKIRGVAAFCINENPVNGDPFCVEIGVLSSKRRTVQIYMVYEDRVQLVKEVTTPEQPCAVSLDGYFLCLALATQYMILNYHTGASQDLFPYNSEERRPIVKRIAREEFLLAAPGGLGKVILASTKAVYVLVPLPLERQIQDLLASHRVEEALILTEGAQRNIPKDKFQILHKRILQQAGFIQFGQLQFLEAKEHFRKGQLDVRELISLYPLLLPASSSFTRCHPPLHEFADLNHLAQGDQEKVLRCKKFLISYLGEVRSTEVANGCREDVDTALLKLYAEQDHDSLLDLLASDNACLLTDSVPWLEKYHKYFALGLLYHCNGQDSAALQLKERKKPIFVSEKKGCHLCHNTFSEPDVVCLPVLQVKTLMRNQQKFPQKVKMKNTLECSRCLPGWVEHASRCFFLSNKTMKWEDARRECIKIGGDLAVVLSEDDQVFLTTLTFQFAQQHPEEEFHSAWIGLQDMVKEGTHLWVNGKTPHPDLIYWRPLEPNNAMAWWDNSMAGQDCVVIVPPSSTTEENWLNSWDDIICGGERHYLCETTALDLS